MYSVLNEDLVVCHWTVVLVIICPVFDLQVVWFITCFGVILMGVDLGLGIGVISALFAVVITLSRWNNFFKTSFNPFKQTNKQVVRTEVSRHSVSYLRAGHWNHESINCPVRIHIFYNNSLFVSQCSHNLRSKPFHLSYCAKVGRTFSRPSLASLWSKKEEEKSRTSFPYLTRNF